MSTQVPPRDDARDGAPASGSGESAQVAAAIQEVSAKAQLLVREEIELAKAEVTQKVNALKKGAIIGAAAGVFVLGASIELLHFLAWLLFNIIPIGDDNDVFWGYLVAAIILLVIAGIAGLLALKAFKKGTPPKPELAIDEAKRIQETVKDSRTKELQR
jgi:hypothetical protein